MQRLPLPFPVRDASDLKRALRHVLRHTPPQDLPEARRHLTTRARQLGRTDLLPATWTTMPTTQHSPASLDTQLDDLAARYGISTAKLKTVYLRGVAEFQSAEMSYGSPTMYGLARVQRFVTNPSDTLDQDLRETTNPLPVADLGVELSIDFGLFMLDAVYSSGVEVAQLFKPGEVEEIYVGDGSLRVTGSLGSSHWEYLLDTESGANSFKIQ